MLSCECIEITNWKYIKNKLNHTMQCNALFIQCKSNQCNPRTEKKIEIIFKKLKLQKKKNKITKK